MKTKPTQALTCAYLWLSCCYLAAPARGQQQPQPQPLQQQPPAEQPRLSAILGHQEALAEECARLRALKLAQLAEFARYLRAQPAGPARLEVGGPLAVQVPAVCLFAFGQFGLAGDWPGGARAGKLEMVSWVFGDELERQAPAAPPAGPAQSQSAHNHTKRQTEPAEGASLLADYLLEPGRAYALNELDTPEWQRLHSDLEKVLANEHFRRAMAGAPAKNQLEAHLSPVVLVPGLLGSRLQARTDKQRRANVFCSRQSDWQDVWLSLRQLLPLAVDCWLDNVRLEFDPSTGFTRAPAGVQARVPDFGQLESVEFLDVKSPQMTKYFRPLIERYEQLGYTANRNLLAAPYDFRLAPQQLGDYFGALRALVERAVREAANGKGATLVCHSMGCTHLLVFLRAQTAQWRSANVRKMIALSSPWAGTVKALKALVVGDQLELPLVGETRMRKLARTYPSIAYLLPQAEVFARPSARRAEPGGPVLVRTPQRAYRVHQLPDLLRDLNLTAQLGWYEQSASLIRPLEPLGDLSVDCVHSLNIPTPETMVFADPADFPDGQYELVKGDGDGTVNAESLLVCADWAQQLPGKVKHKVIMNTNHVGLLSHKSLLTHLTDDVLTS